MVWHELGLHCDGHECTLPPVDKRVDSHIDADRLELLQMLRRMDPDDLEEVMKSLPSEQKRAIGQALLQL
jgi:Mg/Co/Ni transporter MgtE